MTSGHDRLLEVASGLGCNLQSEEIDLLGGLIDGLAASLEWPGWEDDAGLVMSTSPNRRRRTHEGGHPALATPLVAGAPRLSRQGGAYTYIAPTGGGPANRDGLLGDFPFAVKDLVAVRGRPVRAGSAVRTDARPQPRDAPVVARLRELGGRFVGTTALHEFAFGVTGLNDHDGTPRNPHDPNRVPGGSSSGSAVAVWEGSAQIAVGTDTGGSVRIPAALCGVIGFKPSFGTYPPSGVFPLAPSLDHVGLLGSSVREVARFHEGLGGPPALGRRPRRVGIVPGELRQAEPTVRAAVERVLALLVGAGCTVSEMRWPDPEEVQAVTTAIMFAEAAAIHRRTLETRWDRYGRDVLRRLLLGMAMPAPVYVAARRAAVRIRTDVRRSLAGVDFVVGPTVGVVAPTIVEARRPETAGRLVANTRIANLARIPALSLPIPGTPLPVGLQVMAETDGVALSAGMLVEALLVS